jgi:ADP-heptose:LPS heptosyltransferase
VHSEFAERFFERKGLLNSKVAGLNPSGTWKTKVWGTDKFTGLGRLLARNNKVLIFWGTAEEKQEAEKIKAAIGVNAEIIPETDLKYMGALVMKCNVFITNDTGPMHISWILGVNTVAIFGPTNPELQGPLSTNSIVVRNESLDCLGCNLTRIEDCPYEHKCMRDLSVSEVYNAAMKYL